MREAGKAADTYSKMNQYEVLRKLESLSNPKAAEGMVKYGITSKKVYGVSIPILRKLAKEIGLNHLLALKLWETGSREAKILASMIDEAEKVTEEQMEDWVVGFDCWEVCDQCCMNLFWHTPFAYKKAVEWSSREEEFVKRAGFAMIAILAWKDKNATDSKFVSFFPIIKREAVDERNFIKKAVNWALRQIGKRNLKLNAEALKIAKDISEINSKSARWIASDAIRELTSDSIRNRLRG